MTQMNQQNVLNLVRCIEQLLIEIESEYVDALAASLYIASVCANNMGMTKETFLKNCETLFEHDKREQLKELQ